MVSKLNHRLILQRLESRLAPSGNNIFVSQSTSALYSDTAGGSIASSVSSILPSLSADGRYSVFASISTNLANGQIDNNGTSDIFVYDKVNNSTELISRAAGSMATAGDGQSIDPSISDEGRFIAFTSTARNLLSEGVLPPPLLSGTSETHIYRFDRVTGKCQLVDHRFDDPNDTTSDKSEFPLISANGQSVVFTSYAIDLVAGFPISPGQTRSTYRHLYIFDGATGSVSMIDHQFGSPALPVNKDATNAYNYHLSADGRYVAFGSSAINLIDGTTTGKGDAYRYDRLTGINHLISSISNVTPFGGDGQSSPTGISADGQWVAIYSRATNLIAGLTNGSLGQAILSDVENGVFSLVSHSTSSSNSGGNSQSIAGRISPDGRFVTYASMATDLIANFVDGNGSTTNDHFIFDRLSGQSQLINAKPGAPTTGSNGAIYDVRLRPDGMYVVYSSVATDMIDGFIDGNSATGYDVYLWNRQLDTRTLLTNMYGSYTTGSNGDNKYFRLSADGNTIALTTFATNLANGLQDLNTAEDVFLKDLTFGTITLASRRNDQPSLSPGGASQTHSISADGRWVAFSSTAINLVPGQIDRPNTRDVFLLDRWTNTTILVSRAFGSTNYTGAPDAGGFSDSSGPVISGDGRFIAYCSWADNLVAGFVDSNGPPPPGTGTMYGADVFLYDRTTGINTLVSHQDGAFSVGGDLASGALPTLGIEISMSDDGQFVTYASSATNLVSGFVDSNNIANGKADIYLYDRLIGTNTLVSHAIAQPLVGANQTCEEPRLSADGNTVVYWGRATNVAAGTTGSRTVFLYDRVTDMTTVVSHGGGGPNSPANGDSNAPAISTNGQYVVFRSSATNLVVDQIDINNVDDIFLFDRFTGQIVLISHTAGSANTAGNRYSDIDAVGFGSWPISNDGRFVVYHSAATDLVTGVSDNNGIPTADSGTDVFLFDRLTASNKLLSRSLNGTATANFPSDYPAISGDGRFVAFESNATNLVSGQDTTSTISTQIYVYDRLTDSIRLITHDAMDIVSVGNKRAMHGLKIDNSGSVVAYAADASNLVAGDHNGFTDIFAYVTPPPRVTSVQINDGSPQRSIIRSLTITFDDYVFLDSNPLSIVSGQGGVVGGVLWAAKYQDNSTIVSVTFTWANTEFGSLADGNYELRVIGDRASGVGFLDGNGDGIGGDDFTFTFHRLFGDANGDRLVSAADFNAFRLDYGGSGMTFDFNNDGVVTAADFMQFRLRYGVTI